MPAVTASMLAGELTRRTPRGGHGWLKWRRLTYAASSAPNPTMAPTPARATPTGARFLGRGRSPEGSASIGSDDVALIGGRLPSRRWPRPRLAPRPAAWPTAPPER